MWGWDKEEEIEEGIEEEREGRMRRNEKKKRKERKEARDERETMEDARLIEEEEKKNEAKRGSLKCEEKVRVGDQIQAEGEEEEGGEQIR